MCSKQTEAGDILPKDNHASRTQVYQAIGELTAGVKSLGRSIDLLREDQKKQHDALWERVADIELDQARREGGEAKVSLIRGIVLTVFGGAVGAALIKYFTDGGQP